MIGLRSPLAHHVEIHRRQDQQGGNPKCNRCGSSIFGRFAQNHNGGGTAIRQQQLGLPHPMRHRMGLGIERQLVAEAPGENADPKQNQGGGQRAQPQPLAGQANLTMSCGIGRRNRQGRMVMMMPQSFDVFKTGSVSRARNRFAARDLQSRYAIR